MSGKGWGVALVKDEMGGPGAVTVISSNRCNLPEGLLKFRTVVSYTYGHIRPLLDQEQHEPREQSTIDQSMINRIVTAMNETYRKGGFVLLKQCATDTNPRVFVSGPDRAQDYTGVGFGYTVVAGAFNTKGSKQKWLGRATADTPLEYNEDTFGNQYGNLPESAMLVQNLKHSTIRDALLAETMLTVKESWDRVMRLMYTCLTEKFAPRSLWCVTVDGEQIEVQVTGLVRGTGRVGSLRIEEEGSGMWHFYVNNVLVVELDTYNRHFDRPSSSKITKIVQCPFTGVRVEDNPLMPFDWGGWPDRVSCTAYNKQSTFDMKPSAFTHRSETEPLDILAWNKERHIEGTLFTGLHSTRQHATVRDAYEVLAEDRMHESVQESRSSVAYNACCLITSDPSSKLRAVEEVTTWLADSVGNAECTVPELKPENGFTLVPVQQSDSWTKPSTTALLVRFGASPESLKSWCVGGAYGHKVDALEAVISWADATDD